ncbi:MAG: tubulin-like doman-containing protein [Pirellulales bacterium]
MLHPLKTNEPVPGYIVKERIGVGGYGEVWSASAPGGLTKAIKFVYGYFDDARAARELRALDRIKQVRHPFLLSLERFEIVDGQLIIVTELADMSLKDRFEQAKQSGSQGIPRDELIDYLRDAADALDYMSENFSLQHLDVKPENLLLVGGRVKVADFGLVKNLHDVTASMMGGLTPIYAAPEVFDDRPTSYSDQYSLAIVYQELLTGHLPFPGRTPAQLASQHLHACPRLATLPAADQLVISQALCKNPIERFPNCRSLIDALVGADHAARARKAQPERPRSADVSKTSDTASVQSLAATTDTDTPRLSGENAKTQVLGGENSGLLAESASAAASKAPPLEPIADLPPIDMTEAAFALRPTLFIGIGGTAGRTLRRLRRRLRDRYGPARAVPAMQTLLLDTDSKNLCTITPGDRELALGDGETMALPLRLARDYTADSRGMMQWLSRRWLYNIPRSLQTEGRRPLGRLALVDHAPQVIERLRAALASITSPEALAASSQATGVAFRDEMPRVFLVASVSGGTGGGMALDLAYIVRQILADLGFSDDGFCGILTHSTDRNPTAAELATANAYAFLTELHHFGGFGYSPGVPACGLPPSKSTAGAFPHTYFVHLGHDLNDREFEAATDVLASYLYLNSATPAAAVFEKCRALAPADTNRTPLRSFSLATIGSMHTSLPAQVAEFLGRQIVDRWRGAGKGRHEPAARSSLVEIAMQRTAVSSSATSTEMALVAAGHAAGLELSIAELREQVALLVEKELGGDADAVFERLRAMVDQQSTPGKPARTLLLLNAIRRLFDPAAVSEEVQRQPPAVELQAALARALKPIATPKGRTIAEWILEFVNNPAARVAGALQAREWYAGHLRDLEAACWDLLKDVQHNLRALEQTLVETEKAARARGRMFGASRAAKKHNASVDGVLLLIVGLRIQEFALQGVYQLVRMIAAGVAAAGDQLKDQQRELGQWSQQFEGQPPWEDLDNGPPSAGSIDDVGAAVARHLRERLPDMVHQVDARFQAGFLEPNGGLRNVCEKADALRASALEALRAEARAEVLAALKQIAIDEALLGSATTAEDRNHTLRACLDAVKAKFTDCGGAQRLLTILPASCASSALRDSMTQQFTPPATIITDTDSDLVFCNEQQQLSLAHVAARLIDGRSNIIQIAGRLHTRVDVPWSELPQHANLPQADSRGARTGRQT